jgi:heterotetrameric sarcosine oxidase gamma subunit
MFESHSALESYRAQPNIVGADGIRALRLGEIAGTHLIQVGLYPGRAAQVAAAASPILGEGLPDSSVHAARTGDHLIMRIAPDQYWVVGGESGLDARLRNAIPVDAGCVTPLDGARTRLLVEGPAARALLGRLVAIDLHPTIFPIDAFAQTGIHHVGGLLLRVSEDRYEFFALRTYAASIWEVLLDAARPFGYEILLPENLI